MKQPIVSLLERALLWGIRVGIVLLLLTPFVVSENSVYPFVVGKALYARALIEVVFGFWTLLAVLNPAFRPPRSWLLLLLAAGLAWSAVAAGFGVSPQRSLWSNYERMTGWVDAAHWLALTVVAASVLRSLGDLRVLLGLNLGAGVAVALLAIASYFQVDPIVHGMIWERSHPRIGTVFGNPAYLGIHALVNFMIALGFLARSLSSKHAVETSAGSIPIGRIAVGLKLWLRRPEAQWALRLLLALAAGLELWALSLSGSLAALAGLLGAVVFLALAYGMTRPVRKLRVAAFAAAGLMAGMVAAAAVLLLLQPPEPRTASLEASSKLDASSNPLLQRMTPLEGMRSYQARQSAWRAGLAGFADRPWLGWGPENFIVVFGRHAEGLPAEGHVHDRAHNELIEKAVAEGLPGLAGCLALWAFAFCVVVRTAKAQAPGERAFALFVGAALAGYFLTSQLQFDTAALKLQLALLFAFAVGLELSIPGKRPGLPAAVRAALAPLRRKACAAAIASGGAALALGGLFVNQAIHAAATALLDIQPGQPGYIERTIAAFPPLASEPRKRLFNHMAHDWEKFRVQDEGKAKQLLADADAQAQAAIAAEPENWHLHRAAARMYLAVAVTEPAYRTLAERRVERALELAPNL